MLTIGQRIKERREALDMSQEELAKMLGYKSKSSINKIELGVNKLTQSKIYAIATALQTTPSYIMGWKDAPAAAPAADPLHKKIDRLDDVDKIRTEAYVDGLLSADKYQKNTSAGTA